MEKQAAGIDECVDLLEQDVLDLLSLRGVITKLSTNWRELKLLLREKGLLRDTVNIVAKFMRGETGTTNNIELTRTKFY